jgi:hypothetical protein
VIEKNHLDRQLHQRRYFTTRSKLPEFAFLNIRAARLRGAYGCRLAGIAAMPNSSRSETSHRKAE